MRLPLLVATALGLALAGPAAAGTATFTITRAGFVPSSVTVHTGDTVTWTNADTRPHRVVADRGEFSSPVLRPGQSFAFRFGTVGTFGFHDGSDESHTGGVLVNPAPPSVTIAASRSIVVYGDPLTLAGTVSSLRSGEQVTVLVRPFGQSAFAPVTTVTTAAGGAWTAVVQPSGRSSYKAQWLRTTSAAAAGVLVRPRVTLRVRSGLASIKVSAQASLEGKLIIVQRRSPNGRWVGMAKGLLDLGSVRRFRLDLPPGLSLVRAFLPRPQPEYLAGFSGVLRIRR